MPFSTKFRWLYAVFMILAAPLVFAAINGLEDFNGNTQNLHDYTGKGKWTIVMMWASDCHVCNQEAHNYVAFHKKHQAKKATVLGISMDGSENRAAAENFLKMHKLNFPNLIGEPEVVASLFRDMTGDFFRGTPTFLFFSPDGELRAQQAGGVPTDLIEKFMISESVLIEQEKKQKQK